MMNVHSSPLLRQALVADAATSAAFGLLMLIGAGFLLGGFTDEYLRYAIPRGIDGFFIDLVEAETLPETLTDSGVDLGLGHGFDRQEAVDDDALAPDLGRIVALVGDP